MFWGLAKIFGVGFEWNFFRGLNFGFLREFLFLKSKSKKIEAEFQIFSSICMNFWYFGMKFACKGVAVLIFEA